MLSSASVDGGRTKAKQPSLRRVADLVREAVESGGARFTRHAMDEMKADELTAVDVGTVLRSCAVTKMTGHDIQRGTWTYQTEGRTADGARVAAIVAVADDPGDETISIVTVWRLK
jgi:hypothetical protein